MKGAAEPGGPDPRGRFGGKGFGSQALPSPLPVNGAVSHQNPPLYPRSSSQLCVSSVPGRNFPWVRNRGTALCRNILGFCLADGNWTLFNPPSLWTSSISISSTAAPVSDASPSTPG